MTNNNMNSRSIPKLVISRKEAEEKIQSQVEKGNQILHEAHQMDPEKLLAETKIWSHFNEELLIYIFGDKKSAAQFQVGTLIERAQLGVFSASTLKTEQMTTIISKFLIEMDSIGNRLELFREPGERHFSNVGNDIFIVHGHDEIAKLNLIRFMEKLELKVKILDELPSNSRTIIEKLEDESESVGFAIALMTPDDIGMAQLKSDDKQFRARQNVILELGYFLGRLGRDKVRILYKDGVEIPSDLNGVLYILMGHNDAWQLQLAKEMKSSGINIDMNKVV